MLCATLLALLVDCARSGVCADVSNRGRAGGRAAEGLGYPSLQCTCVADETPALQATARARSQRCAAVSRAGCVAPRHSPGSRSVECA